MSQMTHFEFSVQVVFTGYTKLQKYYRYKTSLSSRLGIKCYMAPSLAVVLCLAALGLVLRTRDYKLAPSALMAAVSKLK